MRHLLYISPFFPPLRRVGAFRPLKFSRHIETFGWQPVVLCNTWPNAKPDTSLLEHIPDSIIILREYNRCSNKKLSSKQQSEPAKIPHQKKTAHQINLLSGREWLPLGEAVFNIPYALNAARQVLKQYDCKAIVINADPVAALVVGEKLSKETGLPLIADLRDPWGPCELRRPLRPFYTRWIEEYVEAKIIKQASKVILNTETTLAHYLRFHPRQTKDKFTVIRNHGDKALIYSDHSKVPDFKIFTLLFLGSFSRFVRPDVLLHLVAHLKNLGVTAKLFQLALTSKLDSLSEQLAIQLGVLEYIRIIPSVPYQNVGKLMDNADILTLILPTKQRIQAKFYDYLFSDRPILAIADSHPELANILSKTNAGQLFQPNQHDKMASFITGFLQQGRHPILKRHPENLDAHTSQSASKKLADILDSVIMK